MLSGLLFLSLIPHQEARFLLPLLPLLLSHLRLPNSRPNTHYWLAAWVSFNVAFGVLMGTYHQGAVIPGQIWLGHREMTDDGQTTMKEVFWWRTYPPPVYLLGRTSGINTTDLMGTPFTRVQEKLQYALGDCRAGGGTTVGLVAPWSSLEMTEWRTKSAESGVRLEELWRSRSHLNLDDMDFAEDGIWATLARVIERRGLVIWGVNRLCENKTGQMLGGDS